MNARIATVFCVIGLGVLVFFLPVQGGAAQGTFYLEFYGDPTCPHCATKKPLVEDFVALHPEVSAVFFYKDYLHNSTNWQELETHFAQFGVSSVGVPIMLLNNSGKIQVLMGDLINAGALEAWLRGELVTDIAPWEPFVFGLVFGASPCLLLVMGVLGTTLVTVEDRKKYLAISVGLILGLIVAYLIISAIFLAFLELIGFFVYFKYIFGCILLTIGIWEIIEFKKEKSTIFGTPTRVKMWLKTFVEKQSGPYAFLLGLLFAFVKIPCVGGAYLTILYDAWYNPFLSLYVIMYYIGMLLPVVILLIAIRVGLQSNRINTFREKYRPYLRLLSGIILVALVLYLWLS